ncbi:hypothetical protein DK254_31800 [Pseudomonas sp. RW407]|uniref:hypothetical protein n=2 Tax=unclassified Pseudomonas TaxID=196821 RepID=UPI000D6F9E59|nr:hypothetical protein [Pseudomonas sp. RW407]PWU27096.1 hypothetical protein DK254_31800 [Pseudomonas sp. RW407]
MILTTRSYFFKSTFAGLLASLLFLGFVVIGYPILLLPFCAYMLILTWIRCRCVYASESFTDYAGLFLYFNLSIAPMIAAGVIAATVHDQWPATTGIAASLSPFLLIGAGYLLLRSQPPKPEVFRIRADRVEVTRVPPQSSKWAGLIGGFAALGGAALAKGEHAGLLIAGSAVLIGLYMLFYYRHAISGLRWLKQQERSGKRYTFANIEDIRQWRTQSWAANLFVYLGNALGRGKER